MRLSTDIISDDFHGHFSEEIGRATGPAVLLEAESLEGTWQFTFHLRGVKTAQILAFNSDMKQKKLHIGS